VYTSGNAKQDTLGMAARITQRLVPAILYLAGSLLLALALQPKIPHAYLILLLVAAGGAGWTGRRPVGIGAGLSAAAALNYFFLEPVGSFRIRPDSYGDAAIFMASALAVGWLGAEFREWRDRLSDSSEQFRTLLDGVRDYAVFLLDEKGRVETWNSGAQRMKGYTAEEIIGRTNEVFYSEEDARKGLPRKLLESAAIRGSVRSEGWRKRKDGTRFWADVTITALFGESGQVRGYAKAVHDATEIKRVHDELEGKEEELRAVVESTPDGVLMADERGKIIFANGPAEKIFGYEREELLGKRVEVLVAAKYRRDHGGLREKYQKEPHARPMGMGLELHGARKDGSEFPVEISLSPAKSGKERRFVASVRDITERKKLEQELQTSKIQDLAQVMIRDIDGRIVRWNSGMEGMYEFSREEAEGEISHNLLKTIFPCELIRIEAELLRTGSWRGELVHQTKSGRRIYVSSRWVLHRDKDGKPWRILESSTDVTAMKEAQEKERQLNVALEQKNAALVTAKAMIEAQTQQIAMNAKMSALGEMAGGMAHEINNPMGIIHARASDLKELAAEQEVVPAKTVIETMDKIRSTATRVTRITMALRKFSRDSQHDEPVETRVQDILDDTLAFCVERLRQNSVELRLTAVDPQLRLECRAGEISQVILNLLNNAVDAIQPLPEKWVAVEIRDCRDKLEIRVTDSGPGIPEHLRAKLGQPFFTTKEVGRGTGLGLSISRGIIEAHGGRLRLDTSCEHTRFIVQLPKAAGKVAETIGAGVPAETSLEALPG
jgi:PAS domain S-box-containing protein